LTYEFLFGLPLANLPYLLGGARTGLGFAAAAAVGGLVLAVGLSWVRQIEARFLSAVASVYVEVARNTPLLVQLFLAYFGLPSIGINMTPATTAVLVLTLNNGAYMTEILRGGIGGIRPGQIDAGLSLALTRYQVFRHVILPPAIRSVSPALANQFIALTLATSLASQIAAEELTYRATLLEARIFHSFEIYAITLAIYFVMAQAVTRILDVVIRRVFRRSPVHNVPQL
jgi:polar amino acid transport system permease protein